MKQTTRLLMLAASTTAILFATHPAYSADGAKTAPGTQSVRPTGPYYGMGPGMMGGYGMGPGMMGGYGMGPGAMGQFWGQGLNLSPQQAEKIYQIMDATRRSNWTLMGEMMEQQAMLRNLYDSPRPDEAAIDKTYQNFGHLRQQMFENMQAARSRMESVLTKEQRERMHAQGRWGMMGY